MPTRTNKRTGEVQEMRDGQWVTIKPGSGIQTRGPDQTLPARISKGQTDARVAILEERIKTAEANVAGAKSNADLQTALANLQKTQAELEILKTGGNKLTPQVRADAIAGFNFSKQLGETADQLTQKFNAGPGATKGLEGLKDYLPLTANQQFDTAANKSRGIVGQTLGFTGGQLNTPREAEAAIGPYLPQSSDRDQVVIDKINSLRELARSGHDKAIQILGGVPDENGNIVPVTEGPLQQPANDPLKLAGGSKTRSEVDPVLKAVGTKVGAMLVNGTPDGKILQFLRDSGVPPSSTSIMEALGERKKPTFREWMRANPGQIYPIGPEFYTKEVPMSASRRLFNKTAATDIGGAAAAGLAASANSIAGDRLGSMVGALGGDPEAARTGMELLRTNHPLASLGGDVAGQASLEGLAGLVPGAQGLLATRVGRRGADALYGAYSGSGDSAENAGAGGALGALSGLGFGMAARGAQKAVGNTLTGVRDAGLQYLHSKKIPLTLGQIARGIGTISDTGNTNIADDVGKGIAGIEERLSGIPGTEAFVNTARQRGDVGFNKEMFRQIAPGVTGTGSVGLANAKAAEAAAYSKLDPVRFTIDPQFDQSLAAAEQAAAKLPHHSGDVRTVIGDIRDQIDNGEMSGKGFQTALRAIRKTRATLNDDVGDKAKDALTALENEVAGLGSRQGGQVAQDLAEANAIHARRQIVKQAMKGAVAQRAGEMISPSALNAAAIANTTKFGGLDRALSEDRPFRELTTTGMQAIPNLTPDSGTAGRLALIGALTGLGGTAGATFGGLTGDNGTEGAAKGGGMGLAGGLTLGGLLAAPYSKGGQKLIQNALLGKRPRQIQKLGDILIAHPNLAGLLGQAGGRDYFFQDELPQ